MRLLSYNILDGGEGRADPIAEVIIASRPDIVVLIEADDQWVLDRISARLKMDCIQGAGKSHAVAILSHWPIRDSINHGLLRNGISRSLLEATVVDPAGTEWLIGAAHLPAGAAESDEAARERDLAELLDVFAPRRAARQPHIIAGDFNANAPSQKIDPAECKERTREQWKANGGKLPRRIIQTMLNAGYSDAVADFSPEMASSTGTFSTQQPGQRVDYIFTHGIVASRLRGVWIEQDRLAKYCSDHFPVGAEVAGEASR
jgi:endonuclease/exonuclease/phosphatase family metal-dependent hydrolase